MNPLMNPADFHEKHCISYEKQHFSWKALLFIWKASHFMKSAAFSYEKHRISWKSTTFHMKCATFHEKRHFSLWAFRLLPSIGLSYERPINQNRSLTLRISSIVHVSWNVHTFYGYWHQGINTYFANWITDRRIWVSFKEMKPSLYSAVIDTFQKPHNGIILTSWMCL